MISINIFKKSVLVIAILSCSFHAVAASDFISGTARVVDGDTLEISGAKIRIHGIDAPESQQTCHRNGVEWLCGKEAGQAMRSLVDDAIVKCEIQDRDRYGRFVSLCKVNGRDVGAALISMGLALAFRQYSNDYVAVEAGAKASRVGMWSGQFVPPWEWRQGKRLEMSPSNDNQACLIKGNISQSGERIFHVPGGQYYGRTKISPEKGERYFCTEEEATSAGWRKSRR